MVGCRLLLFDLDGTLLGPDRRVRLRTLQVLARLGERGVRLSLATGRSPMSAASVLRDLVPSAPAIHFNGALLRDWHSGADLLRRALPVPDALAAVEQARDLDLHVNLYLGDEILIERRGAVSRASEIKDGVPHTLVDDLCEAVHSSGLCPTKLLCIGEPRLFADFAARVRGVSRSGVGVVNSEPDYFEVLPAGTSKGAAAAALAVHLGLELSQVVAFGDNLNDLELLEVCGLGVAMGDGHPELLARADRVIGPHDSDAIAELLGGWFGL